MLRDSNVHVKGYTVTSIVFAIVLALLLVLIWMVVSSVLTPFQNVALAQADTVEEIVVVICEKQPCDPVPIPMPVTGSDGGDDDDEFQCEEPTPEVTGNTQTTFRILVTAQIYFGPDMESGTGMMLPEGDTFYILNNPSEDDGWIMWSYHGCAGARWLAPGTPVEVAS